MPEQPYDSRHLLSLVNEMQPLTPKQARRLMASKHCETGHAPADQRPVETLLGFGGGKAKRKKLARRRLIQEAAIS